MIHHYLDASAWVKRYSQEIGTLWTNFIQIQLTETVVQEATQRTSQLALRGADSIHLASATTFRSRIDVSDSLIFITSDQELKMAAQIMGMEVIDPEIEDRRTTSP